MPTEPGDEDDPVVASYDIFITDAQIRRFLLQHPDHHKDASPYNESYGKKPSELRLKPQTGLVEVDVPLDRHNYDERRGARYGNAMKQSGISHQGGTHGFAGGFNTAGTGGGGGGGRMKAEDERAADAEGYEDEYGEWDGNGGQDTGVRMMHKTVGGRVKTPAEGDPIYMLGAFRENQLHLAPLSAVVQLRPQMHHLDAVDEVSVKSKALAKAKRDADEEGGTRPEPEGRAVDMKIKSTTDGGNGNVAVHGNNELLKKMQEERWEKYEWVDENDEESWEKYHEFMFNLTLDESPQLHSAIKPDEYVDSMSAPRVDPVHPEMTGSAMKSRRKVP